MVLLSKRAIGIFSHLRDLLSTLLASMLKIKTAATKLLIALRNRISILRVRSKGICYAAKRPIGSDLPFHLDQIRALIDFKPNGVIHVGGHLGQEIPLYRYMGLKCIAIFEPQSDLAARLQFKYKKCKEVSVFPFALGSKHEEKPMYLEADSSVNLSASSSFLKPVQHLDDYPHVRFGEVATGSFSVKPLDWFGIIKCNLLVIDTQGFELEVLKGAESTLKYVDYVICEYWQNQAYEGVPTSSQLVNFLNSRGFRLVIQTYDRTMGNLFMVREK
jgi:FkbM family methyltransferase